MDGANFQDVARKVLVVDEAWPLTLKFSEI
jgi:hypothetical protein